MKFFIDTAEISEIRAANELGLVDGVTTNPSLIAKSGRDFRDVIAEIAALVDGPISAEVIALDADGMVAEGRELAKIDPKKIVIKVPMTADGLKATRIFAAEGISTNVTLVFSPLQALLAAKAGATYVSPFVGRLDDVGHDGMEGVEQINTIFDNYGYTTEIIVASVRSPCMCSGGPDRRRHLHHPLCGHHAVGQTPAYRCRHRESFWPTGKRPKNRARSFRTPPGLSLVECGRPVFLVQFGRAQEDPVVKRSAAKGRHIFVAEFC